MTYHCSKLIKLPKRKIAKIPCGLIWSLRKIEIGLLDEGLYLFLSDFDECNNGSHDCHSNATCINTAGYFECKCKDGYIGDGRNCTGRDQLKHIVSSIYFKYFWPCNFQKLYLCCYLQCHIKLERAKNKISEKNCFGLRKPLILHQKHKT